MTPVLRGCYHPPIIWTNIRRGIAQTNDSQYFYEESGLSHLPVIVGMGGVNAAGRTSGHQAFRRTVLDSLPETDRQETLLGLASLMNLARCDDQGQWFDAEGQPAEAQALAERLADQVLTHTLIRRIEDERFNATGIPANRQSKLTLGQDLTFTLRSRQLPEQPPADWQIRELDNRHVEVTVPAGEFDVLLPDHRQALVRAAGQLPSGFAPEQLYRSVHHPRGLSMTIFGASDCLGDSGLDWDALRDSLDPDDIAVYAGNSIGQMDAEGWGGLMKSFVAGERATSKQMPLGYAQMPADFLNAYVLGNVGGAGAAMGACASFLYNLKLGLNDIRSGRRRVVMVGTADAPITPEVIEGFRSMGALADDESLKALDALEVLTDSDYQKACRPFARNCGFTIAEATQFVILMADDLALDTGARIIGSVPDVFVNADGWKRSISAPGVGNYITLSKAVALARDIVGDEGVRQRSFVHAHATSTPKNRTTESHVLNEVARANDIQAWPVVAVKSFVGHSQGSAAGDQAVSALGSMATGILPGIPTLDAIADDVHHSHLDIRREAREFTADVAFINAKGFGGNNASGVVLSADVTLKLLAARHGEEALAAWRERSGLCEQRRADYLDKAQRGEFTPTYRFGEGVLEGPELEITDREIRIPGYAKPVSLKVDNPFGSL